MPDRDVLDRWALFGGDWRVVELDREHAVVSLCACTGEQVERLESRDPELITYLRTAGAGGARRS